MEDFKLDKFVKSNEGLNNDFYSFDMDKSGYTEAFLLMVNHQFQLLH